MSSVTVRYVLSPLAFSAGPNWAAFQFSFPNFLYEMSDNPSEKNDSHGNTKCGEFYACQESM